MKNIAVLALLGALILFVAGCGGGSGTGTGNPVSLYITDNVREEYSHVWASIRRVDLVSASGATTVFEDPAGKVVDLRALRDTQGEKFALLTRATVPNGTYTGLQVVLAEQVTLVPKESTVGQTATFAGASNGLKTISVAFAAPRPSTAATPLVLDFDLAQWTVANGVVTAPNDGFAKIGNGNGLQNPARHVELKYRGTITGFTGAAPTYSFRLTSGVFAVTVETTASTTILNSDGSPNPVLANGKPVEVEGKMDAARNVLVASKVKIRVPGAGDDPARVSGTVEDPGPVGGPLQVRATLAGGFLPGGAIVTVATTNGTKYLTDRGAPITREEFWASLAAGVGVEAEGVFANGVLTATKLKLDDEPDGGAQAEVAGTRVSHNAAAKSFVVSVQSWFGANLVVGAQVTVNTTPGTVYRLRVAGQSGGGEIVSAETFFAQIGNAIEVEAEGGFNPANNTMVATKAKIKVP
jgi:hypothetical protein